MIGRRVIVVRAFVKKTSRAEIERALRRAKATGSKFHVRLSAA